MMRRKGLRFPNGIPRVETMSDKPVDTDIAPATGALNGDLRYRVAYVIAQADGDAEGMAPASCDYEMADAVIEALGLKQQGRYGFHRCVSEWTPDE